MQNELRAARKEIWDLLEDVNCNPILVRAVRRPVDGGVGLAARPPPAAVAARGEGARRPAASAAHPALGCSHLRPLMLAPRKAWHDSGTYDKNIPSWPACGGANGSIRFEARLSCPTLSTTRRRDVNYTPAGRPDRPLHSYAAHFAAPPQPEMKHGANAGIVKAITGARRAALSGGGGVEQRRGRRAAAAAARSTRPAPPPEPQCTSARSRPATRRSPGPTSCRRAPKSPRIRPACRSLTPLLSPPSHQLTTAPTPARRTRLTRPRTHGPPRSLQLGSATAIEHARGPKVDMIYGRVDVASEADCPPEGAPPDTSDGQADGGAAPSANPHPHPRPAAPGDPSPCRCASRGERRCRVMLPCPPVRPPAGRLPDAKPPFGDSAPDAASHLRNVFHRMGARAPQKPPTVPIRTPAPAHGGSRPGLSCPAPPRPPAPALARVRAPCPRPCPGGTPAGFTDQEIVALSGAHTIGRAFKERSGASEYGAPPAAALLLYHSFIYSNRKAAPSGPRPRARPRAVWLRRSEGWRKHRAERVPPVGMRRVRRGGWDGVHERQLPRAPRREAAGALPHPPPSSPRRPSTWVAVLATALHCEHPSPPPHPNPPPPAACPLACPPGGHGRRPELDQELAHLRQFLLQRKAHF